MKKPIAIISTVLFAVILGIVVCKEFYYGNYHGEQIRVNIPEGASDVPLLLRQALGDSFGGKVARLWKLQSGDASVSHGSYLIKDCDNSLA